MKLKDLNPSTLDLHPTQTFYRVQLTHARTGSVDVNGLHLAPAGLLAGRFCLPGEVTAYLADSPETALYESVFRRELVSCAMDKLRARSLVEVASISTLRLADFRAVAGTYPLLQAQRFGVTQGIAAECRAAGLDGLLYASAQHPGHANVCLFSSGASKVKVMKRATQPLVKPGSSRLLSVVADAARRSAVPLV